jgi:adhesin/invasin
VDAFGNQIAGVDVLFEVTAGGGFAVGRNAVTNANGVATVGGWTLGDAPGTNTLRATVSGSGIAGNPVLFQATATPGLVANVTAQTGTGQSAAVNTAVAIAPSVVVRDARGNAVPGVAVQFIIGSGNGTLTGANATTNSAGVAAVGSWTLGPVAGTQTLIARVSGLPDTSSSARRPTLVCRSPSSC